MSDQVSIPAGPTPVHGAARDAFRAIAPDTLVLIGDVGRPGGGAEHALRSLTARPTVDIGVLDTRAHPSIDGAAILSATGGSAADLALICALPAATAAEAVEACAAAGVGGVAIVGVATSPELNARLATVAESSPIRILGPNAFGPFNAKGHMFLRPYAGRGDSGVAIFTQSGNFLGDVVGALASESDSAPRIGWALGNMIDLDLADAVGVAASDSEVGAVAVHCEGLRQGRRLMRAIRDAAKHKPVVVLLAGTSDAGKRATISHTASLGVRDVVAAGAAKQAGASVAARVDEFAILADNLGRTWPASGTRVGIVADGGGHATLATDRLIDAGFTIAQLGQRTLTRIAQLVGHDVDPHAPLDVDDLDRPTLAFEVASILAADPDVDLMFLVGALGSYATHFAQDALAAADLEGARRLTAATATIRKPVVAALIHRRPQSEAHRLLREGGVAVVRSLDHAVTICRELVNRGRFLAHVDSRSTIPEPRPQRHRVRSRRALTEPKARALLSTAGIDTGSYSVVTTAAQCADAVCSFDRPCALKIVSPSIVHKANIGGVILNVTPDRAEASFGSLLDAVSRNVAEFKFDGVLVSPMASPGVELLLGAYRDPDLGPCVAVGAGGHLVELLRDVVFHTAPVTPFEADEMLAATRVASLFDGYRGAQRVHRDLTADLIVALSRLIADSPTLEEIDLNPVIAAEDGPQLVDVRVVVG